MPHADEVHAQPHEIPNGNPKGCFDSIATEADSHQKGYKTQGLGKRTWSRQNLGYISCQLLQCFSINVDMIYFEILVDIRYLVCFQFQPPSNRQSSSTLDLRTASINALRSRSSLILGGKSGFRWSDSGEFLRFVGG